MPKVDHRPVVIWGRVPLHWRVWFSAFVALMLGMILLLAVSAQTTRHGLLNAAQQRAQLRADQNAQHIEGRLANLRRAAGLVASDLDESLLANESRLFAHLQRLRVFRSLYDNVFIADVNGQLIAYADEAGLRRPGRNIADRPYFQQLVESRQSVVSEPVVGRVSAGPVVVVAAPILDREGHVIGAVGGALRLSTAELLADLVQDRRSNVGRTLFTDAAGTILAHPDAAAVMRSIEEVEQVSKANRVSWAEGQAGVQLAVSSPVRSTGWNVWTVVGPEELFGPLGPAFSQSLLLALGLAALLSALLLTFLKRQFSPLQWLSENAQRLALGEVSLPDRIRSDTTEAGRLARALDEALAARAEAEKDSKATQHRLGVVMAASPVGIVFSRAQKLEVVNEEAGRLLGWPVEALQGRPALDIYASSQFYADLGPRVAAAFARSGTFVENVQMRHASGSTLWVRLYGRPADVADPAAGTIWSFHDVEREVAARRKLEHAALHDRLTGLANRDVFMSRLEEVFASSASLYKATVLMMDLDHFKPVNDTAGHAAGDAMLMAVAQELQRPLRSQDLVARLGGDEFAVILAECDATCAAVIAQRLIDSVAQLSLPWHGKQLRVGITVGMVERAAHHTSAAAWLARADAALYEAKRAQRGTLGGALAQAPSAGRPPTVVDFNRGR